MSTPRSDWLRSAPVTATNAKADTPLFPYLVRLVRGEDMGPKDAAKFFRILTDQNTYPRQIAAALTALTAKGETGEELVGMASVMRSLAIPVKRPQKTCLDIAGTGSSDAKTFNVSTAAALVAAGAGLTVAKQSNRGVTSNSGSVEVLAELGVKPAADPEIAHIGKIGQPQPTRRVFLPEDDVLLAAVQRPPGADAPFQRAPDAGADFGRAAADLVEDGDRPQAGSAPQQRHHLAVPHRAQRVRASPTTRCLLLGSSRGSCSKR